MLCPQFHWMSTLKLRLNLSKRRISTQKKRKKSPRLFSKATGSGIAQALSLRRTRTHLALFNRSRIRWTRLPMLYARPLKYQLLNKVCLSVILDLQVKKYSNAMTHTKTNHS